VTIEIEALAIEEGELRLTLVAREERSAPRTVRKCRTIDTSGEEFADVVELSDRRRAVGSRG
jgi:hypothetical protein